jgi:hypothetical protein
MECQLALGGVVLLLVLLVHRPPLLRVYCQEMRMVMYWWELFEERRKGNE